MIGYLSGTLQHLDGITLTIVPTGLGIGYDIFASPTILSGLSGGDTIQVWIHHHQSDAGESLFGFASPDERSLFRELLKVSGVGGKTALSLLGLGETELLKAIQFEDDKLLSGVPGIGKKTAQKIIVELKGSINFSRKKEVNTLQKPSSNHATALVASLVGIGYDKRRVEEVVESLDPGLSLQVRTVEAIKRLST